MAAKGTGFLESITINLLRPSVDARAQVVVVVEPFRQTADSPKELQLECARCPALTCPIFFPFLVPIGDWKHGDYDPSRGAANALATKPNTGVKSIRPQMTPGHDKPFSVGSMQP